MKMGCGGQVTQDLVGLLRIFYFITRINVFPKRFKDLKLPVTSFSGYWWEKGLQGVQSVFRWPLQ